MSSANKVGEIFTAAGTAFSKLGELTMQLHPAAEPAPGGGKWTDQEIEMLRTSVKRFADDINKVSAIIKSRTMQQIRSQLKRKAYEEAGMSPPAEPKKPSPKKVPVAVQQVKQVQVQQVVIAGQPHAKKQKASEVTLSALNAPEIDVDIMGLGDQSSVKKLEFDSDVDSTLL